MVRLMVPVLALLLLMGPLIAGFGSSAYSAGEATAESAGSVASSPGCGSLFVAKAGDEAATADEYAIPPELIPEEGVAGVQGAAGASNAASQQAQGAGAAGVPADLLPDECDYDATGVLWCNQGGSLVSNCAELPDGNIECP